MGFLFKEFSKLRISNGLSQEDLADKSGVSASRIKNYECGRRKANEEDVKKMCEVFNVRFNDYYKKDTVIVPFLSNKGGSTKTTSCANLGFTLANDFKKKVLLIDTDLQQNLTQHYNMDIDDEKNFYVAFNNKEPLTKHIRNTEYQNIDIVTSHDAISMLEGELVSMELREFRFRQILDSVIEDGTYDYVMIDCNPSLNLLNRSILYASTRIIIPLEPSSFGLRGVQYVMNFVSGVKENYPELEIMGVLVNKFDSRKRVPKDVIELVSEIFGDKGLLFKTKIPVDTCIEQCQMMGEPLGVSFEKCRANIAFNKLAEEVIKRG